MTHDPSVSLCLIVKDESSYLPGCVASAKPLVDEVVIVDTGSTDGTTDLAWGLADAFCEIPFGGDFSAARNEALARANGEWILFLDADERIVDTQVSLIREFIRTAPTDVLGGRFLRYNLFANGTFYTGRELRLFRNDPAVHYRRKINESVAPSIADAGGKVAAVPAFMNHFGHCRPVHVRDRKAYRYLSLMDDQLSDRPNDAVLIGYKGLILRTLGRFEEALQLSERAVGIDADNPTVWFFRGHVLRSVGEDGAALAAYQSGLGRDPSHSGLHTMVGVQLTALGEYSDAEAHFVRARACDPQAVHTDINLGLVAQASGDWTLARQRFEAAAAVNPGFLHEEWSGRTERDPYRAFYTETVLGYAGLAFHLAYARDAEVRGVPATGR